MAVKMVMFDVHTVKDSLLTAHCCGHAGVTKIDRSADRLSGKGTITTDLRKGRLIIVRILKTCAAH